MLLNEVIKRRINIIGSFTRAGNLAVKVRICRLQIRAKPQKTYTQRQYAQEPPADEAHMQTKESPPVTCHQHL